jgi:N-methylhydantoinase B/oxoprolinase/acetone carboxylase alpha subunit
MANAAEEPEDETATKQVVELAERPEEIVLGEKSCQETLRALRSSRQYCQSRIAACHNRGDEAMARQWVQTLQAIAARQTGMEDRLRDMLERDGKTMSVEAAEQTYRKVFADLRQKLLAAPAALAAQLNPQDPVHAQKIMENWVQMLFKETNK